MTPPHRHARGRRANVKPPEGANGHADAVNHAGGWGANWRFWAWRDLSALAGLFVY
jgi:hypothetical protein